LIAIGRCLVISKCLVLDGRFPSKKFKNTNMIYNISVCEKSNIKYVVTSIKTVQCKMHLVLTYENVQKPKKFQNKLNMPLQRMMGKLRKI
jgi:hypothetical protein